MPNWNTQAGQGSDRKQPLQVNTALPPLSPFDSKPSPSHSALFRNGPSPAVTSFVPREPTPTPKSAVSALSILLSNSASSSAASSPAVPSDRKSLNPSFRRASPALEGMHGTEFPAMRLVTPRGQLEKAMFRQQMLQDLADANHGRAAAVPPGPLPPMAIPAPVRPAPRDFGNFAASFHSNSDEDEDEENLFGDFGDIVEGDEILRFEEDLEDAQDELLQCRVEERERDKERRNERDSERDGERESKTARDNAHLLDWARERDREKEIESDSDDGDSDFDALPSDAVALSLDDFSLSQSLPVAAPSLPLPFSAELAAAATRSRCSSSSTESLQFESDDAWRERETALARDRERQREREKEKPRGVSFAAEERERGRESDALSCGDLLSALLDHDLALSLALNTALCLLPLDLLPLTHTPRERERESDNALSERERETALRRLHLFAVEEEESDDGESERVSVQDDLPAFSARTALRSLGVSHFAVCDERERVCLFVRLIATGEREKVSERDRDRESDAARATERERDAPNESERERQRALLYEAEEFYTLDDLSDGDESGAETTQRALTTPCGCDTLLCEERECESDSESDDFDVDTRQCFRSDTDEARLRAELEKIDREREREREKEGGRDALMRERDRERERQTNKDDAPLRESEREFFVLCRRVVSDVWRTVRLVRVRAHERESIAEREKDRKSLTKKPSSAAIPIVFASQSCEREREREERERVERERANEMLQERERVRERERGREKEKETKRESVRSNASERETERERECNASASQDSLEAFVHRWEESAHTHSTRSHNAVLAPATQENGRTRTRTHSHTHKSSSPARHSAVSQPAQAAAEGAVVSPQGESDELSLSLVKEDSDDTHLSLSVSLSHRNSSSETACEPTRTHHTTPTHKPPSLLNPSRLAHTPSQSALLRQSSDDGSTPSTTRDRERESSGASLSATSFLFPNDREFLMDGLATPSDFRKRSGSGRAASTDARSHYLAHLGGSPSQSSSLKRSSKKKKELLLEPKKFALSPQERADAMPRRHTYNSWGHDEIAASTATTTTSSSATADDLLCAAESAAPASDKPREGEKKTRSWSMTWNRLFSVFSFSGSSKTANHGAGERASDAGATNTAAQFALVDDLADLVSERDREPARPFEPLILPTDKPASVLVEVSDKLADRVKR